MGKEIFRPILTAGGGVRFFFPFAAIRCTHMPAQPALSHTNSKYMAPLDFKSGHSYWMCPTLGLCYCKCDKADTSVLI